MPITEKKIQESYTKTLTELFKANNEDIDVSHSITGTIISNCTITTVLNKERVFKEAFRLLEPGSIFEFSCIKGALTESGYKQILEAIGFVNITINIYSKENISFEKSEDEFFSCVFIKAQKPMF